MRHGTIIYSKSEPAMQKQLVAAPDKRRPGNYQTRWVKTGERSVPYRWCASCMTTRVGKFDACPECRRKWDARMRNVFDG